MTELEKSRFTDDYLLYLLARASELTSREFHAEVRRRGLTVPYWRVLASLSDGDAMTIGELARRVLFQQPTLTKIIGRMERAGLVRRHRRTRDRRQVSVRITDAGRRAVTPLLEAAKQHESRILEQFRDVEEGALKRILRALIARYDESPG